MEGNTLGGRRRRGLGAAGRAPSLVCEISCKVQRVGPVIFIGAVLCGTSPAAGGPAAPQDSPGLENTLSSLTEFEGSPLRQKTNHGDPQV